MVTTGIGKVSGVDVVVVPKPRADRRKTPRPPQTLAEQLASSASLVRCGSCIVHNGNPPGWCPARLAICPYHRS